MGEWKEALEAPPRSWFRYFFNPRGNLYLASHSMLRQIESEIGDLKPEECESFPDRASFRLLQNLVRIRAAELGDLVEGTRYQFALVRVSVDGLNREEQFLLSQIYEA